MKFEALPLKGAWLLLTEPAADNRGYFARTFCTDEFSAHGLIQHFPQQSVSFNKLKGTLRGLHFQRAPKAETKLVRCSRGSIYDVIVDLREESDTFGQWYSAKLSADNGAALYIPEGIAHGFISLEDSSEVSYMISPAYEPGYGQSVLWNDPDLAIEWPMAPVVISEQDKNARTLKEFKLR